MNANLQFNFPEEEQEMREAREEAKMLRAVERQFRAQKRALEREAGATSPNKLTPAADHKNLLVSKEEHEGKLLLGVDSNTLELLDLPATKKQAANIREDIYIEREGIAHARLSDRKRKLEKINKEWEDTILDGAPDAPEDFKAKKTRVMFTRPGVKWSATVATYALGGEVTALEAMKGDATGAIYTTAKAIRHERKRAAKPLSPISEEAEEKPAEVLLDLDQPSQVEVFPSVGATPDAPTLAVHRVITINQTPATKAEWERRRLVVPAGSSPIVCHRIFVPESPERESTPVIDLTNEPDHVSDSDSENSTPSEEDMTDEEVGPLHENYAVRTEAEHLAEFQRRQNAIYKLTQEWLERMEDMRKSLLRVRRLVATDVVVMDRGTNLSLPLAFEKTLWNEEVPLSYEGDFAIVLTLARNLDREVAEFEGWAETYGMEYRNMVLHRPTQFL